MDLRKTFIKLYRCLIWQKNKALAKWYNLELLSLVDNALWICSLTARWWDSGGFSSELHYLFQSDFRLLSALVGGFDRINRVHSVKLLAGQHCRWCSRYYNTLCQTLSWIHGGDRVLYPENYMTTGTRHTMQKCIIQWVIDIRTDCQGSGFYDFRVIYIIEPCHTFVVPLDIW